jgi:hypothetical protein
VSSTSIRLGRRDELGRNGGLIHGGSAARGVIAFEGSTCQAMPRPKLAEHAVLKTAVTTVLTNTFVFEDCHLEQRSLQAPTVLGPHLSIVVLPLMLLINSRSNFRACNMTLSGN